MKKIIILLLCFCSLFFISCKDKNKEEKSYSITFIIEEQSQVVTAKTGEYVSQNAPSKTGYNFDGWYNGSTKVEMPYKVESQDMTFTAKYSIKSFDVTFKNDNGSIISSSKVNYGQMATAPNEPTKNEDEKASYSFLKWDKELGEIFEDTTYTAVYSSTPKQYTYKFVSDDEVTTYKSVTADYGTTIVAPSNPTKQSDSQFTYSFSNWDVDFGDLTEDIIIKAVFTKTTKQYTYKFVSDDGKTTYKSVTADYGTTIVAPENPTKNNTAEYTYSFSKWDQSFTTLTKNVTIKAVFNSTKNKYTFTFFDEDGKTILKQDTVEYGTVPTEPDEPTKASDDDYDYKFNGWDKEVKAITGDTTYTAKFKAVTKQAKFSTLEGKTLSILGDSISTFYVQGSLHNSYYSAEGTYYYPKYCSTVNTWDKTWWGGLLNSSKMVLGINNSWSGSCASGSNANAGYQDSRMNTIDDNGVPDIFIVYLGTNDCAAGYTIKDFSTAMQKIIDKARTLGAKQIFLTTLGYSAYTGMKYTDANRIEYNKAIRSLATTNNCGIVPIDEYVVADSYSFYLHDYLHYNPKGAALLSQIFEKAISEYNGIEYTKEITVQHKEQLPEGVIGKVTATASAGFWTGTNYASNVYLFDNSTGDSTSPTFSLRIEISKNAENGKYYVTKITKSGVSVTYTSDYTLCISDSHTDATSLKQDLANVVVGAIVEFDENMEFPLEITFKEGDGEGGTTGGDPVVTKPIIDANGVIHVSNYNKNVFGTYETELMIYSTASASIGGNSYMNFYVIGLVKDGDNYKIVSMKKAGDLFTDVSQVNGAEYVLFIYTSSAAKPFYNNASINQTVKVEGAIDSGDCTLELIK